MEVFQIKSLIRVKDLGCIKCGNRRSILDVVVQELSTGAWKLAEDGWWKTHKGKGRPGAGEEGHAAIYAECEGGERDGT